MLCEKRAYLLDSKWVLPNGYDVLAVNNSDNVPWWSHFGDLPCRACWAYRGIPYWLCMTLLDREEGGYQLELRYWKYDHWELYYAGELRHAGLRPLLDELADRLLGENKRLRWHETAVTIENAFPLGCSGVNSNK